MTQLLQSLGVDAVMALLALGALEALVIFWLWRRLLITRAALERSALERAGPTYKPGALLESVNASSSGDTSAESRKATDNSQTGETAPEVSAGEEKVYDFVDPSFDLEPIVPESTMLGKEENLHGDAFHGNEDRYVSDAYAGRISRGAELELLDRRVYKNEFTLDIIKVRVLTNEWKEEIGKVGWVGLDETSFRGRFDVEKREII